MTLRPYSHRRRMDGGGGEREKMSENGEHVLCSAPNPILSPETSSLAPKKTNQGRDKLTRSSNIGRSAGDTDTVPFGLSTIPRKGLLNGMGRNTPRLASFAPVHRFGSHWAKSHIRNSKSARGSTSPPPALTTLLLPLEPAMSSSPLAATAPPTGMQNADSVGSSIRRSPRPRWPFFSRTVPNLVVRGILLGSFVGGVG